MRLRFAIVFLLFISLPAIYVYWSTLKVPLFVLHAGSLTVPFADLKAAFERAHPGVEVVSLAFGSVEAARQVVELGKPCDVLAVSDYHVIERMLLPTHASWYLVFARNEIVIAYTNRSRYAEEINASNWYEILLREGVTFGRSDPDQDPCGYRTLLVWKLAELHYNEPSLYEKLLAKSPEPTRPKEVDLIALLQAGELDYAFEYLSVAVQHGLRFVRLPDEVSLGNWKLASFYAQVNVSTARGVMIKGEPILYGITIPTNAPHPDLAVKFVKLLLSPEGQRILAASGMEPVVPALTNNLAALPEELRGYAEQV